MKALVLGGGGREHALAWKLAQSPLVQTVYVAPGNGGTATDKRLENIPITDVVALREWAQHHQIDITVVGPEALLAAGVVDEFRAHGLRIFGPTQAAAQLESSKAFSKDFMRRHGIPTAKHPPLRRQPRRSHRGQSRWTGRWQRRGGGHQPGTSAPSH
jgi:phosphoribosylamine--glycine ligase